ncbi:MAG TPA: histone deacetylase [Candidatus Obscuribacterales bacterium]
MQQEGRESILVYSPEYNTDLTEYGVNKPFALDRGQCVLDALARDCGYRAGYLSPAPVPIEDLLLVHTAEYLESLHHPEVWQELFEFTPEEYDPSRAKKQLNELFNDIRLKCGGTLLAAEIALARGLSANLGGGYHHAFPDRGRGFCALHDIAVAIRSLMQRGRITRALVVDLDFHQGDGTAVIFQDDPTVFTLSVHSQEGWPEEKQQSTLDVPIASDAVHLYQQKVEAAVRQALASFTPDLVVYVAGSDPYELDVLPGTRFIKLSLRQMEERDRFVIDTFADRGIPLAMVFAGGYGPHVWEVHYRAVRHLLERAGMLTPARESQLT